MFISLLGKFVFCSGTRSTVGLVLVITCINDLSANSLVIPIADVCCIVPNDIRNCSDSSPMGGVSESIISI